ncbi:hypothetical protein [Longimycelium tulufanense]|uniref:hypothetical protein n=1 Tax=Longimycelium tulufanense TaxID=907463 RepID=UPI0016677611|nr:hypothetical protein [Longimycelium tulufanense]
MDLRVWQPMSSEEVEEWNRRMAPLRARRVRVRLNTTVPGTPRRVAAGRAAS